ncbi:unnamed protein product [Darwinula stevensoni]|uniref:THSD1 third Ig-like domain-containing protein n=1 Tax=Darwinula stevensoni TaxID=69355 RepID=A0A7R9ABY0_9CRUS|nr:unnamed protein product [Darwinula stevensoni]CAG0899501.1 unnamed protein product [Darwinula stevensoni]
MALIPVVVLEMTWKELMIDFLFHGVAHASIVTRPHSTYSPDVPRFLAGVSSDDALARRETHGTETPAKEANARGRGAPRWGAERGRIAASVRVSVSEDGRSSDSDTSAVVAESDGNEGEGVPRRKKLSARAPEERHGIGKERPSSCRPSTAERVLGNAGGRCSGAISATSPHVAFHGDLLVTYNVTYPTLGLARASPAYEIRLWDPFAGERELASRSVFASRAPEGTLVFPCGTVYHEGLHRITLTRSGEDVDIDRISVLVRWPPATFRLPDRVHAYANDLTVRVDFPEILCGPSGRNLTTWFDIWDSTRRVVSTRTTTKNAFGAVSTEIVVPCRILGPNDRFRAILWAESAEIGRKWKVASSSEVKVDLGPDFLFRMDPHRDSVFPCSSAVAVRYRIPPCAGEKERIRVYGRRNAESSRKDEYLEEVILTLRQGKAEFECWKFNETYAEYCLKYVNVDPLGRVRVLDTLCIPTFLPDHAEDGGWRDWSEWSPCMGVCRRGKKIRHRVCHPLASHPFCSGPSLEESECEMEECNLPSSGGVHTLVRTPSQQECGCGCELSITPGIATFLLVDAKDCNDTSIWFLQVPRVSGPAAVGFLLFGCVENRANVGVEPFVYPVRGFRVPHRSRYLISKTGEVEESGRVKVNVSYLRLRGEFLIREGWGEYGELRLRGRSPRDATVIVSKTEQLSLILHTDSSTSNVTSLHFLGFSALLSFTGRLSRAGMTTRGGPSFGEHWEAVESLGPHSQTEATRFSTLYALVPNHRPSRSGPHSQTEATRFRTLYALVPNHRPSRSGPHSQTEATRFSTLYALVPNHRPDVSHIKSLAASAILSFRWVRPAPKASFTATATTSVGIRSADWRTDLASTPHDSGFSTPGGYLTI